jgi:glycine/D-amino acid oxidase-like deaminating enzyme
VKPEPCDDKTIIHNYGHGGTGHSLGWGTGLIAAELALAHSDRRAAVIGCGTVGLSAARQLQRRGFDVTIYAASVPPDTTSNMALAGFTPTSGLLSAAATPEFVTQFRRAAEITYRELQLMAGSHYGVSWIDSYNASDNPPSANASPSQPAAGQNTFTQGAGLLPPELRTGRVVFGPGEHPFPFKYATRRPTIRIEPAIYLDALLRDVLLFGGHLVIRKFESRTDLMSLPEPLIVNCTGLGSRELFGDKELVAVKGQLVLLVPQAEVNYQASGGGANLMPRNDGMALGTTMERDQWTLEPNLEARVRVVEAAIKFFGGMLGEEPGLRLTRGGPPSQAPAVESFFGVE